MLAPITHILPLTTLRRARLLPLAGRVQVRIGQKVNATDVVAEANLKRVHVLLDVYGALGMARGGRTERIISRKVGDRLQKGDVIAERGGIVKRVLRAPADGIIMAVGNGQVLLEAYGEPFRLQAGLPGTVVEVIPEGGAIIESSGALLQGVWGNGRVEQGVLTNLLRSPADTFDRKNLDVSMRGAILLGGHCADPEALKIAGEFALRGLVLGSLAADLKDAAAVLPMPVILLEGFGRIPINRSAFQLLTSSDKRDVALNAQPWDPSEGRRPEVFLPLPASGPAAPETDEFKPGQTVRIHGAPHDGKCGTIASLSTGLTLLPNGLRARTASLELDDRSTAVIPLANLDVLE